MAKIMSMAYQHGEIGISAHQQPAKESVSISANQSASPMAKISLAASVAHGWLQ
jgi:hypothetical protein